MKNPITPEDLEEKRKQAGFSSQLEAAKNMGVSLRTYQRWISGENEVPTLPFKYLSLLAVLADVSHLLPKNKKKS